MNSYLVILLNLAVLALALPVADPASPTDPSSEDGRGNHDGSQPQPGMWHLHQVPTGGFGGMPSFGVQPGLGGPHQFGPRPGYWSQPQTPPEYWSRPLTQPGEGTTSPGYGPGFTNARVGGPWSMMQGHGGLPGIKSGMRMGMMSSGMGMTPPGMGMTLPGMGMSPGMMPGMSLGAAPGMGMSMTPGMGMSMTPGTNMGMVQGLGMALGMGMMPQAFGFGGLGTLGLMDFLGGGEDFMEDMRDQNSDDLEADEQLSSSKARLEKYLQKQWQLGKRKLQVQVDFGNVPLEWEYLNQYHGVRHPLAMTAFGPKYGLAGPPSPMYDYGYGPVQQGRPPMPSSFFGPQTPGFWQQPQFGPAPPVQQPEASIQVDESVLQPEATQ